MDAGPPLDFAGVPVLGTAYELHRELQGFIAWAEIWHKRRAEFEQARPLPARPDEQLAQLDAEVQRKQQELDRKKHELAMLDEEQAIALQQMAEQQDALRDEVVQLEQRREELEAEIAAMEQASERRRGALLEQQQEHEALHTSVAQLHERRQELESELSRQEAACDRRRAELAGLEARLEEVRQAAAAAAQELPQAPDGQATQRLPPSPAAASPLSGSASSTLVLTLLGEASAAAEDGEASPAGSPACSGDGTDDPRRKRQLKLEALKQKRTSRVAEQRLNQADGPDRGAGPRPKEPVAATIHLPGVLKAVGDRLGQRPPPSPVAEGPLSVPELAEPIALAAGMRASLQAACASRGVREVFRRPQVVAAQQPHWRIFLFGGHSGRGQGPHPASNRVDVLDVGPGEWEPLRRPLPTARIDCCAVAEGGKLYVLGGQAEEVPLAAAERLDVSSLRWERLPPLPTARYGAAAVATCGLVIVAGGFGDSMQMRPLDAVEALDPRLGAWRELPPLPTPRGSCAAASVLGLMVVVGGAVDGHRCSDAAEGLFGLPGAKAPARGTGGPRWTRMPSMQAARAGCAAASLQRVLYAMGGRDGFRTLDSVECYDIVAKAWFDGPSMNEIRRDFAAVAVGGAIYIFGGTSHAGRCTARVGRLHPEGLGSLRDTWAELDPMGVARSGCAAAATWL